ncbi:glucuronate isomerase [Alicyclobacillus hesperidum subsp. aegles]|nr:glucuronate isomerase [Alicyclobacillus hesperidum]GLG01413.1 glucuronate isomerase [Alicyclobacillus hesperidum subsp. aegles]
MAAQGELATWVREAVASVRVTDMHTHLFPPSFSALQVSGADNVLTYHYLIAEAMRVGQMPPTEFWDLPTPLQADWIWEQLFEKTTPLSEAALGVVQIAQAFAVDLRREKLAGLRAKLEATATDVYANHVLDLAGVDSVVMTNDPFDEIERRYWEQGTPRNPRFHAALRLDVLLNDWPRAQAQLSHSGYHVGPELGEVDMAEVRRFLKDWVAKIKPVYFAFSAPDTFAFPEDSVRGRLLAEAILPICREQRLPLALMIGVRRQVNPSLRSAGDSTAKASMLPIEALARRYPDNKFLVTFLSREDQHELAVTARKFGNIMPFGCWWFLNTETLVSEISNLRLELIGPTFVIQHSDARVLEHVIYKWRRARKVATDVLTHKYQQLQDAGWDLTREDVERDVKQLFSQNFWDFVKR